MTNTTTDIYAPAVSATVPEPQVTVQNATATQPVLTFHHVERTFDGARVLNDITLEINTSEVIAILGPSGCGKSTLLRAAAGLDSGFSGEISIAGSSVRPYDSRTAVAFQEPRLLPWRTIADNVALGLPRGVSRAQRKAEVEHLLAMVGLSDHAHLRPREISGGMAQRVSLARALARKPQLLLLDEPFGALDALTRVHMQDFLLALQAQISATALLVTHDVDEALLLADRVVVLGYDAAARAGADQHLGPDQSSDADHNPRQRGASIVQVHSVPGERPRNRSAPELLSLRSTLFSSLGIHNSS